MAGSFQNHLPLLTLTRRGNPATQGKELVAARIVTLKWGDRVKDNCENLSDTLPHRRNALNDFERLHVEALRKFLESLEETIGRLNEITMQAPLGNLWDQVRDDVSCLDSIGDMMRQALDVLEAGFR
jgi:hypothetical protein